MNDILTDEEDLLYIKNFTAKELIEIDTATGEKIYRIVNKIYAIKKNKNLDLQNKKNVLFLKRERQKELCTNNPQI